MRQAHALATTCIAIALLSGCASPRNVAEQVVKANVGQEEAHNQLVLLNIVRAYHRMPMHFSKVTAVRLPLGIGNPTFTVPTPWGPDYLQQVYNISTQVSVQQSVDSTPIESQEFMRGITTPVSVNTLLYYLDQGWPQQMILHMFVRSIEVYDDKEKLIGRFNNYPQNADAFRRFQDAIRGLKGCELDAKPDRTRTPYGPAYAPGSLGTAEALAAAKTADLALLPVDAKGAVTEGTPVGYRFFRETKFTNLRFSQSPLEKETCTVPGGAAKSIAVQSEATRGALTAGGATVVLVMRSPEAMLYYLGELARAQLDGQFGVRAPSEGGPQFRPLIDYRATRAPGQSEGVALFRIDRGAPAGSALSVEYQGATYSVPRGGSHDRSMHVISLVTQLLNLQNKGTDAPTTTNVRVVP